MFVCYTWLVRSSRQGKLQLSNVPIRCSISLYGNINYYYDDDVSCSCRSRSSTVSPPPHCVLTLPFASFPRSLRFLLVLSTSLSAQSTPRCWFSGLPAVMGHTCSKPLGWLCTLCVCWHLDQVGKRGPSLLGDFCRQFVPLEKHGGSECCPTTFHDQQYCYCGHSIVLCFVWSSLR